ncbi:MAG: hypothetical protein EXS32_01155 [Opitutus sp.]|nr:hypothetical protein [Opitutus sp.]
MIFLARRLLTPAFALSLFLLVVGAKWAVVDRYGSDLANWDQWDAEGFYVLQPFGEHRLHVRDLFIPHNEHRIFPTKLLGLVEAQLNGQWDARLQCAVNALLHASLVAFAWVWLGRIATLPLARAALFVIIAALTALPVSWQNIISGFHSQQFFLLWFSLPAIVLLLGAKPWSPRWWIGLACAILALISMGSGFFAAAVVFGVAGVEALRDRNWRDRLPVLTATALVIAVGVALRVEVSYHTALKAHSVHDLFLSFWRSLQWPVIKFAPFAVLAWTPWVWLVPRVWRAGPAGDPRERALVAIGGWVLLQFAAAAYARGAGAEWPANRYMDTCVVGLVINATALARWVSAASAWPGRLVSGGLAAGWLGLLAWGLHDHIVQAFDDLGPIAAELRIDEKVTQRYLATGDMERLRREPALPYPGVDGFAARIAPSAIRALMPASVRVPLSLAPASPLGGGFLDNYSVQSELPTAPHRGLSPTTPPLVARTTWGSFNATTAAEWTSAPIMAPLRSWLKFETAGHLGEATVALELRDARTRALLADVRPTKVPGDAWRAAYVRAPRAPFVVVARADVPACWFAFSAPVEMGPLSHLAWQAVKNGPLLTALAGGAIFVLALAALLLGRARHP